MSHTPHFSPDNISFTTPFPIVHSILTPDSLLTEALPYYDLGNNMTCILLTRGVNDTYLVQAGTEKYILRVYSTGWRSLEDILYEIDALLYLEQKCVPVSIPVAQKNGNYVSILQAPEGPRQIVLFTYAQGKSLDRHNATDSYKHGRALAVIHNATDAFTYELPSTFRNLSSNRYKPLSHYLLIHLPIGAICKI